MDICAFASNRNNEMPETAYIVECVRTAGGKKNGALRDWHPISLGAATLDALVEKAGIDGAKIDDVIMGCVMQSGAQAGNVARNCVLASKRIPETVPAALRPQPSSPPSTAALTHCCALQVPGTAVDRQCGSSQQVNMCTRTRAAEPRA